MGKSTISMAIFNSFFLCLPGRVLHIQILSESTDPQKMGRLGFLQGGEERPERPQVKALDPQGQCGGDISGC